jgi:hypothetical protein
MSFQPGFRPFVPTDRALAAASVRQQVRPTCDEDCQVVYSAIGSWRFISRIDHSNKCDQATKKGE